MILVKPIHSPAFLWSHELGVEVQLGRDDVKPGWEAYVPYVRGVHLPYSGLNVAAFDREEREESVRQLEAAIAAACQYPVDRMVVHTAGFETRNGIAVGSYDLMITSFQRLAAFAAGREVMLCIENQVLRAPEKRRIYGDNAAEWRRILRDIDRSNVLLTLDTSHAASSAVVFADVAQRLAALDDFLACPELIGHVHWSDSRLGNQEALYQDLHLAPGAGDLPRLFHARVKRLPVVKLLEQTCSEGDVEAALAFIAGL